MADRYRWEITKMEEELLKCLSAFTQQDGNLIREAEELIKSNSENPEFGKCLINLFFNEKISNSYKLLSLIIYDRFDVTGFDGIVKKLAPIIYLNNKQYVYYAAKLIGKMIKTNEDLFLFLDIPMEYSNVVMIIIRSFFDKYEFITEQMIKYLILFICGNFSFEIKKEAARCLNHCYTKVKGSCSEQVKELNKRLNQILKENLPLNDIFSMILTPENIDFLKTFLSIGDRILEHETVYHICLNYLQQTAE